MEALVSATLRSRGKPRRRRADGEGRALGRLSIIGDSLGGQHLTFLVQVDECEGPLTVERVRYALGLIVGFDNIDTIMHRTLMDGTKGVTAVIFHSFANGEELPPERAVVMLARRIGRMLSEPWSEELMEARVVRGQILY